MVRKQKDKKQTDKKHLKCEVGYVEVLEGKAQKLFYRTENVILVYYTNFVSISFSGVVFSEVDKCGVRSRCCGGSIQIGQERLR